MKRYKIGESITEAKVYRDNDTVRVEIDGIERCFEVRRTGEGTVLVEVSAGLEGSRAQQVACVGDEVVVAGVRRRVQVARPGAKPPPAVVTPPMPAVVARLFVAEGEAVEAGAPLVAVTAMKMEITLRAPHAGVAHPRVHVGDKVMPGDVLVDVEKT